MASIRRITSIIVIFVVTLAVLWIEPFNASAATKTTSSIQIKLIALAQVKQPTLSSTGVATWINVANAKKYQVQLFRNGSVLGSPQIVTDGKTGYNFLSKMRAAEEGSYTVKVSAKGNDGFYTDGPESVASATQLVSKSKTVTEVNLSLSGIATWTTTNGTSYDLKLYKDVVVIDTRKGAVFGYDYLALIRSAGVGNYTITVSTKSDKGLIIDGDESATSATQMVKAINQVAQPVWTANTINWVAEENATNYEVKLFNRDRVINTKTVSSNTNSFDFGNIISQNSPEIFTVTIQAKGTGLYSDGAASIPSNTNVQSATLDQVGKPTLSALGVATWQNAANANNYKVQIYLNGSALGGPQTVINGDKGYNFLPIMRATGSGSYTVKVTAIGDDLIYLDGLQSIASDAQVISKATSVTDVNLTSTGIATWTTTNGTSYDLKLYKNGVAIEIKEGATSGYNYLSAMRGNGAGKYKVTVTVKSDKGLIIDGDESAASDVQKFTTLVQMEQPSWLIDTITWSSVMNAANYEVTLFKDGTAISMQTIPDGTTSYDFGEIISRNVPGEFKVTVQAKGTGLYLDGGVSIPSISNLKTFKLSKVAKPTLSIAGTATWTNVLNATNYNVQLYCNDLLLGESLKVANGETGCNFSAKIKANGPGSYTVKVTAKGEGLYYDGDESETSNSQIAGPIATFNGTAENSFEQVYALDKTLDGVRIVKVTPDRELQDGVQANFTVEVEYNLVSLDNAKLLITARNGGSSTNRMVHSYINVTKGSGKYIYRLAITPKKWNDISFCIGSQLSNYENYGIGINSSMDMTVN